MRKWFVLLLSSVCALPAFAQSKGQIAKNVGKALFENTVPVNIVKAPHVRHITFSEPEATKFLFAADDIYRKAAHLTVFKPGMNLVNLGVVSPVAEIDRFSQPTVAPEAASAEERLVEPVSRYNFEGNGVAFAGKENAEILKREASNREFAQTLAKHANEIEGELERATKRVSANPAKWLTKHVLGPDPSLGVVAVGQLPYFHSEEAVTMMQELMLRLKRIYPYRPVVLVTPFVAQDMVFTAASDFALLQQDVQLQAFGTPQIVQTAAQNGITVVGAGLRSHQAANGTNYVFYAGKHKDVVANFSDTAVGQKEQALYLTSLLQKYRRANPRALLVVWAPSEFVAYNGYVSVSAAMIRQAEKTQVVQISGTESFTRFEQALPKPLQEKVTAVQGFVWSPWKNPNFQPDWISGMNALVRVTGGIELP